jgi:hypothetical protein
MYWRQIMAPRDFLWFTLAVGVLVIAALILHANGVF